MLLISVGGRHPRVQLLLLPLKTRIRTTADASEGAQVVTYLCYEVAMAWQLGTRQ